MSAGRWLGLLSATLVLVVAGASPTFAAFPGTPGLIAYSDDTDIWTVDPQGSTAPRKIVEEAYAPAWSPDGTRLAYVHDDQLWTAASDGSSAAPLKLAAGRGRLRRENMLDGVAWSRGGTRLAFVGVREVGYDDKNEQPIYATAIYSARVDGTRVKRLTEGGSAPRWTSRGVIALQCGGAICTVDENGKRVRRLVPSRRRAFVLVDVSPDGRTLLASRERSDGPDPGDLWTVDLRNGEQRRLLSAAKLGDRDYADVAWSPDGQRIVFTRYAEEAPGNSWQLRTIGIDGSDDRVATDPVRAVGPIAWQAIPSHSGPHLESRHTDRPAGGRSGLGVR